MANLSMLKLRVSPPKQDSYELPLSGGESQAPGELVVGRSNSCDVSINDSFMSRRQARFFEKAGSWYLEDLASRNGTLVNGKPITDPVPVRHGDEVRISNTKILIFDPAGRPVAVEPLQDSANQTVYRQASDLLSASALSADAEPTLVELQRHTDRLRMLNEVHQALASSFSSAELLEMILDRVFDHLEPEEGVIVLMQEDGSLKPASRRTAPGHEVEHPLSATLVREVVEKGQAALVLDIAEDERFSGSESIVASGVHSLIAAPLGSPDGNLGMIALNSRLSTRRFTEADLELLTSLAAVAGLHMRNLALAHEAAERRRLESEVGLAREIQVALLPDQLPTLPGYSLYAGTVPSQGVSGDFYEIVAHEDGTRCTAAIVDVSGKGIGASLLTASIEALLAAPLEQNNTPDAICEEVSRRLFERTPAAKYATLILASLDLTSSTLRYANAGHNPALVLRSNGDVERLDSTGPPVGLLPTASYQPAEVLLASGDSLVLYTDGITEAENPEGEEFGFERLQETCVNQRNASPEDLASAINATLDRFVDGIPFVDDRTIVVLRHDGE